MLASWRDPFVSRPLDEIANELLDPFGTGLGTDFGPRGTWGRRTRTDIPRLTHMDVLETNDMFKVMVEAPGVEKDKMEVTVDNGILTVKVTKIAPDYVKNASSVIRNEIAYGTDQRTVRIPRGYHPEPSHCQFKDGVLCIAFPKSQESEAKRLQIESS